MYVTYITDTAVDVAEFLETKKSRAVGGIIECEALFASFRQGVRFV